MTRATLHPRCSAILDFWFGDAAHPDATLDALKFRTRMWFFRDADLDAEIARRFATDCELAAKGELGGWKEDARGRLGLIVLLDQFPRNLHRGSPKAFAQDAAALSLALEGLEQGAERSLLPAERFVFYMPLMHAEDRGLQTRACTLFARLHDEAPLELRSELAFACKAADRHRYIVERFGRFPHRNESLGRESTAEEVQFLNEPNSSF